MARHLLNRESHNHSFTPTALAMTALRRAKLQDQDWEDVRWENRAHFFGSLATAMRHALIDYARKRSAKYRDKLIYLPPDEILSRDLALEAEQEPERFVMLGEALSQLEAQDKRLADAVQDFYFIGYSTAEIAQLNGVSEKTVDRDLKKARVLLRQLMEEAMRSRDESC